MDGNRGWGRRSNHSRTYFAHEPRVYDIRHTFPSHPISGSRTTFVCDIDAVGVELTIVSDELVEVDSRVGCCTNLIKVMMAL